MLCHFGLLQNGSVVTYFIHFSSTATRSATGEYVTISERTGQNYEPAGRNEEQARNTDSSAPQIDIKEAQYDRIYN